MKSQAVVVPFYLIFASLSRSSLKVGHDWEIVWHDFFKNFIQFHLKCSRVSIAQQWTRKIGEKDEI